MDIKTIIENIEQYTKEQQEALRLLKRTYSENIPEEIIIAVVGVERSET